VAASVSPRSAPGPGRVSRTVSHEAVETGQARHLGQPGARRSRGRGEAGCVAKPGARSRGEARRARFGRRRMLVLGHLDCRDLYVVLARWGQSASGSSMFGCGVLSPDGRAVGVELGVARDVGDGGLDLAHGKAGNTCEGAGAVAAGHIEEGGTAASRASTLRTSQPSNPAPVVRSSLPSPDCESSIASGRVRVMGATAT
jgi:hypothetical protein